MKVEGSTENLRHSNISAKMQLWSFRRSGRWFWPEPRKRLTTQSGYLSRWTDSAPWRTWMLVSAVWSAARSTPTNPSKSLCAAIASGLKVENAILDGEIVCVGPDGRPLFNQLLYRRGNPYMYAFDILWLNGQDLRKLPLVERKRRLRRLIPPQPFPVLYTDHEDGHGAELYQAACSLDLEGIVAKWKYGPYVGDDVATSWVKIKNPAYSQAQGRHEQFTKFRRLSLS